MSVEIIASRVRPPLPRSAHPEHWRFTDGTAPEAEPLVGVLVPFLPPT